MASAKEKMKVYQHEWYTRMRKDPARFVHWKEGARVRAARYAHLKRVIRFEEPDKFVMIEPLL